MQILEWITQKIATIDALYMQLDHYEDSETLHQYRVNLRKLQSFAKIYFDETEKKNAPKFTKIIKEIIKPTSTLRDLDVFLEDMHLIECSQQATNALKILLLEQREMALEIFLAHKDSLKYKQNLLLLKGLVNGQIRTVSREKSSKIIEKLHKKMYEKFYKINSHSSPKELHHLRIQFKILRYGLNVHNECFAMETTLSSDLHDLKMLQDIFGVIQDNSSRLQFILHYEAQFTKEHFMELKNYFEKKIALAREELLALVIR